MSEEKLNGNEILTVYDHTVETDEGLKVTASIRKWSLLNAGPNIALCGEALAKVKERRPDFSIKNALSSLDVVLAIVPDEAIQLVRKSIVGMNEKDKNTFLGACDLADLIDMIEVIMKQNFFNPRLVHRVSLLLNTLGQLGEKVASQP